MPSGCDSPDTGQTTCGRVLVVAGSDPSGGAGIQADIKTITMLGGYASTAITALTVQNTVGVTDVMPVPAEFVSAQMQAVLSDIGADAVKTGMLYDANIIETVAATVSDADFDGYLIVDPVMVATSGALLLQDSAVSCLKAQLLPKADLITPNIPEAEVLTGISIETTGGMLRAGAILLECGAKAVLVKGGHLKSEKLVDILLTDKGDEVFIESGKFDTRNTHGTGCTLASAFAASLAQGYSYEQAFQRSHAFVRSAIENAPGYGAGHGPLGHVHALVGKGNL